ncbi:MAG: hypothetical protein WBW74_13120 [Xanthobacteraceae bacterium]
MTQYVHPEFGLFCPTPRLRRWLRVALVLIAGGAGGLAVMASGHDPVAESALAVAAVDEDADVATRPATIPAPSIVARSTRAAERALTDAGKPSCVGDTWVYLDGKCVAVKPRKPRMVRVPVYRPAIASIPLGRSAPAMTEGAKPVAGAAASRQGEGSKAAQAAPSNAATTAAAEPAEQPAATPKKARKTAHNRSRRHDPYGYDRWREVRVDDWYARAYAPRREYRGGYRSFW